MPPLRHYENLAYLDDELADDVRPPSDASDDSDDLQFMGSAPATNAHSRTSSIEPHRTEDPLRGARRRFFELPANFRPAEPTPRLRIPDAPPIPRGGGGPAEPAGAGRAVLRLGGRRLPLPDVDDVGAPGASADTPIDVDDSSDEDNVVLAGPRPTLAPHEFREHMAALDRSLDRAARFERRAQRRHEEDRRMAENAADRLNRHVRSPQPETGPAAPGINRPGWGGGGAVLGHGNTRYHFWPNRLPEVRYRDQNGNVHIRELVDPGSGGELDPLPRQLERLIGPMRGNAEIVRNLLNGAFHLGIGGAGPAGGMGVQDILNGIKPEKVPTAAEGFTRTWDAEDFAKEIEDKERHGAVVELDERGHIVPNKRKPRGQMYLACCACPEPLRIGSANMSPEDRVWSLRCGHVLDQRCYKKYSEPVCLLDGSPERKRRRTGRVTRSSTAPKARHEWVCPVKGCGRQHVSVREDEGWVAQDGLGGMQLYV
ncbi:hypothetical protein CspeluHIS016_0106640 [Cutaneotrichosporon spelunceum]|uniref:Uncharacterized protein n=1 Tax=Cutaneotrichosporon spelunceum TaxID=1672016 RepID=A0AAD3TP00_9TREE|nr:hypothetical protein CspeluHIS016_0106640 [Cutaneotrichosporon spelunceum]